MRTLQRPARRHHEFAPGERVQIRRSAPVWTVLFVSPTAVLLGQRGKVRCFSTGALTPPAQHVDQLRKVEAS